MEIGKMEEKRSGNGYPLRGLVASLRVGVGTWEYFRSNNSGTRKEEGHVPRGVQGVVVGIGYRKLEIGKMEGKRSGNGHL